MNSISEVLDDEEPPLLLEDEGPYGLLKSSEASYALDDLLADAASLTPTREYSALDSLGLVLGSLYTMDLDSMDYGVHALDDESESDPYAVAKAEEEGAAVVGGVVDFTDYLTRRYVDTSVAFPEGSMEEEQDYLLYLNKRSRSLWGSN